MAYKLFLDTNVFLDVFLERTVDWKEAETILQLAAQNKIEVFTSANNLVNVIYSLKKQRLTQDEIIQLLELTLTYTKLSDVTNAAFAHALRAGFSDLEDAVQYYTALQIKGIDYFITSNSKDYKKASRLLPVVTPKQFMVLYNK
jgi:predicted nucleic acid-binding protein